MRSLHFRNERQLRNRIIHSVIGIGNVLDSFVVDRGHPSGAEIHKVTDTAIIIIESQTTQCLITELIARPEQLRRLYRLVGREPPAELLKLAYAHNQKKYNSK